MYPELIEGKHRFGRIKRILESQFCLASEILHFSRDGVENSQSLRRTVILVEKHLTPIRACWFKSSALKKKSPDS